MYAKTSDDVWIAYQMIGDVVRDLVFAGPPRFLAFDDLGLAVASGTEQGLHGE
jgi:hypothetical protein